MAASVDDLTANQDKQTVSGDLYDLLGKIFGFVLTLDPGEPIPGLLDTFTGWFVDEVWNPIVVPALRAPFLDLASGDWLGNTAFGTYDRPRILSQAATQSVTIENRTGGFVAAQAPGQVRIKSTVTGKTYTNTTTLTFDTSSPYPLATGTFEADQEGSGSTAAPGDIARYPTSLVNGPVNCFVAPDGDVPGGAAVAGPFVGSDEEADQNLVERCRVAPAELYTISPPDAYESVALDPLGAFARRDLTPPSTWGTAAPAISRAGVVTPGGATIGVYLASTSGPAAGDTSTPDSDVFKAWQACLLILPPGFTLTVQAATAHTVALGTVTLYVDRSSRVTAAEATATATLAIDAFFSTLRIGGTRTSPGGQGYVFADAVIAVFGAGRGIINVGMTFADVALGAGEVAVPTYTLQAQLVTQ